MLLYKSSIHGISEHAGEYLLTLLCMRLLILDCYLCCVVLFYFQRASVVSGRTKVTVGQTLPLTILQKGKLLENVLMAMVTMVTVKPFINSVHNMKTTKEVNELCVLN